MMLKTHQTGPEGQKVRKVYVEEGLAIDREFYLGHDARPRPRSRCR